MFRRGAGPELSFTGWAARQQLSFGQQPLKLARHGGTGIDQADRRREHLTQQRLEEGVMGAAQNNGVATRCQQRPVSYTHLTLPTTERV